MRRFGERRNRHVPAIVASDLRWICGEEHEAAGPAHVTVTTTQVNALAGIHVESMSDEELSRYLELLRELRELLPAQEPKILPGTRGR